MAVSRRKSSHKRKKNNRGRVSPRIRYVKSPPEIRYVDSPPEIRYVDKPCNYRIYIWTPSVGSRRQYIAVAQSQLEASQMMTDNGLDPNEPGSFKDYSILSTIMFPTIEKSVLRKGIIGMNEL